MVPILFEDRDVLAVDKPEGLAAIPERSAGGDCLLRQIEKQFGGKHYVVHRLDKEVSGVILFGRNPGAHRSLCGQFNDRSVRKTYVALVHGILKEETGLIDAPVREFGSGRMGIDPGRGKPSQTEFRVIERFRSHTLTRAFPLTGRRHQIRVHLYHIGHPIAGDLRYGERSVQKAFLRLMLHAERITFRLLSGEEITVEAPLPGSFVSVVNSIRNTCFYLQSIPLGL